MPAVQEQPRASPDALLEFAQKERRGHLKVFLGAAPGVGKTCAMLTAARLEKAQGRDVVIGVAESHGRRETEALLEGLEVIPRKPMIYMGTILSEFDLDKALARRPDLLIIDECAHTNIPGSRHPKRWQDIEELLAAGIHVWTTLNVQHLESLSDVVHKITGVRVRETVPDHIFEKADEIILVDLSPEELLKRLAEGKVYVPAMAAKAVKKFFRPGNLTALRELALRRAAERIDADLLRRMKAQAAEGPWPAGERILACIGPDANAPRIVRKAKRLADVMDAPWFVITVERPGAHHSETARRLVQDAFKLAASLGAETRVLLGTDIAGEILKFANSENISQIVVARSRAPSLAALLHRSLPHELLRRAQDVAIHLMTPGREDTSPVASSRTSPPALKPLPYLWSALGVAVAVVLGRLLTAAVAIPNVSMIFLLAVLVPAVVYGIRPAIFASLLSFLAYNFFFIEPRYTFTIARPHELFALVVFLAVAIITSALAGRVREQARLGIERTRAARRLYEFSRKLSELAAVDDVALGIAAEVHSSLRRPTAVLLDREGELELSAAWPPEDALDSTAMTAARWALQHNESAGAATKTLPLVPWYFVPLRARRGALGVLGVRQGPEIVPFDPEEHALLDTLTELSAAALDRAMLARDVVTTRTAVETERVRNTLLASISHDFRTPLASILGSASTLLDLADRLDAQTQRDLLAHIKGEAASLDEMVRNLLAITRIDAGSLELRRDWVDLGEIARRVAASARRRRADHIIEVKLPAELPLVHADAALAEQALANVVGNALAHTPCTTRVTIEAHVTPDRIALRVTDDGPGITPELLPHVFDKFVRGGSSMSGDRGAGTGLGLAIAKGIVEAHGGSVKGESPVTGDRGTRVVLSFLREEAPP